MGHAADTLVEYQSRGISCRGGITFSPVCANGRKKFPSTVRESANDFAFSRYSHPLRLTDTSGHVNIPINRE